ncbi:MAG: hypothetical protein E7299_02420 [Lachnospiraceae bacterium]|nr:hypothetical protein [Lachnospiraceae bacterium]
MAITYEDFLGTVEANHIPFVDEVHKMFLDSGCKLEIKQAKQGYVITYVYMKDKKRIAVMNYVFRKSGMLVRIYARHVQMYQGLLDLLPEKMKQSVIKAGDCKKLTGVSECSPTCTAGYDFVMDGVNYKKCKNSAFFWLVEDDSKEFIKSVIEKELCVKRAI